jgi:hypothetical protein
MRRVALLAGALLAMAAVGGRAGVVHPQDAVAGHPGVTYLDLARQLAPSLAMHDADHAIEGQFAHPPRHLAGKGYEGPPPDPLVLGFMEDERIVVGGKRRIVVLADFGHDPDRVQSATLLLLFDDAPTPKLLDTADVSIDQDTEFSDPAVLRLGPGDEGLVAYSEHDDADLTMGGYLLVSVAGDRLRMIDLFPVTSARLCGWEIIETPKFSSAPDPGHTLRRLDVAVSAVVTRSGDDACGPVHMPRPQTRVFRASYHWNAARRRYQGDSSAFRRLRAFTDAIMKS